MARKVEEDWSHDTVECERGLLSETSEESSVKNTSPKRINF